MGKRSRQKESKPDVMDALVAVPAETETPEPELDEGAKRKAALQKLAEAACSLHIASDVAYTKSKDFMTASSEAIVDAFAHLVTWCNWQGFTEDTRRQVEDSKEKTSYLNGVLAEGGMESKEKRKFFIDKATALAYEEKMTDILGEEADWTVDGVRDAFASLKLTSRNAIRKMVEKPRDKKASSGEEGDEGEDAEVSGHFEPTYEDLVKAVAVMVDPEDDEKFIANVRTYREKGDEGVAQGVQELLLTQAGGSDS